MPSKPPSKIVRPIYDNDGGLIHTPATRFPALIMELDADDKAWVEGYRYVIEQLDGDTHYFQNIDRASDFCDREGLKLKTIKQMDRMRDQGTLY